MEPKNTFLSYETCFYSYIKSYSLEINHAFQKNILLDYLTSYGVEIVPILENATLSSLFIGTLCRTERILLDLNNTSLENIYSIISNPSLNYDFKLFGGRILTDTILEPVFKKLMLSPELSSEQKTELFEQFVYNFQPVAESTMRHNSGVSVAVHSIIDQQVLIAGLPIFLQENLENNKENCELLSVKKNAIIQIFQTNARNIEILPQI